MNPKIRVDRYVNRNSHLYAQTQFNEKIENKEKKITEGKKYLNALNNDVISAHKLFDKTPHQTIYLWNSLI